MPENVAVVQKSLARDDVERVFLHAGVMEIAEDAFRDWDSLQEVVFAKGSRLETIGAHAFARTALREFTAPSGLKEICDGAFMNCKSLKEVRLNEGLERIGDDGDGAFQGSGVETVQIYSRLQKMGERTFLNCRKLRQVEISRDCEIDIKRYVPASVEICWVKLLEPTTGDEETIQKKRDSSETQRLWEEMQ